MVDGNDERIIYFGEIFACVKVLLTTNFGILDFAFVLLWETKSLRDTSI